MGHLAHRTHGTLRDLRLSPVEGGIVYGEVTNLIPLSSQLCVHHFKSEVNGKLQQTELGDKEFRWKQCLLLPCIDLTQLLLDLQFENKSLLPTSRLISFNPNLCPPPFFPPQLPSPKPPFFSPSSPLLEHVLCWFCQLLPCTITRRIMEH